MYTDLSHLKPEEMDNLMERYYNGETVKKLLDEFKLNIISSKLYTFFPPKEFPGYKCDYCESILVAKRPSKTRAHRDTLSVHYIVLLANINHILIVNVKIV